MIFVCYVFLALSLNMVLGAYVWAAIDDDKQSLLRWYRKAPFDFVRFLVLQLWFVGVFFYFKLLYFKKVSK